MVYPVIMYGCNTLRINVAINFDLSVLIGIKPDVCCIFVASLVSLFIGVVEKKASIAYNRLMLQFDPSTCILLSLPLQGLTILVVCGSL